MFFPGYDEYIQIDWRYGDVSDGMGIAQCFMNSVEVALTIYAYFIRDQDRVAAWLAIFISAAFTFWKTVLYLGSEAVFGFDKMNDVPLWKFLFLYLLPSSFWIGFPAGICYKALHLMYHTLHVKENTD